jgi:hypothetical protein
MLGTERILKQWNGGNNNFIMCLLHLFAPSFGSDSHTNERISIGSESRLFAVKWVDSHLRPFDSSKFGHFGCISRTFDCARAAQEAECWLDRPSGEIRAGAAMKLLSLISLGVFAELHRLAAPSAMWWRPPPHTI